MCDQATSQLIQQAVNSKLQNDEPFSAHDVTRAVRQLTTDRIAHNEVRSEVHKMFSQGDFPNYTRTLGNIPGLKGQQPWIFHPIHVDPNQHVPQDPQDSSVPQSSSQDDDDEDDDTNGLFKVDSRLTLCIPASMVREAGFTAGDEAFVSADNPTNSLIVTKTKPVAKLSSYTVNKNCNVRVTQHSLRKAGLAGSKFVIKGEKTKVVVKKG